MKKIYNWLVPPELVQQISSGRTGEQVLTVYIKLALRIILPLIVLSFVLIALTTIRLFETPSWLSPYFSVDLKLDGQTIANYVAMIFGTVVAFAGSLVAITLAMEAQKTSEETKKLEEAGQRRETEKYAREIKKELNTFFRLLEKAFRTIETLPNLRQLELYFSARYLVRVNEYTDGPAESTLSPENERTNSGANEEELKSINFLIDNAIRVSTGLLPSGESVEMLDEPLRRENLESVLTVLQKPTFTASDTPLTMYTSVGGVGEKAESMRLTFQKAVGYLFDAYDMLEKQGCIWDLVASDKEAYEAFFDARTHIEALVSLSQTISMEQFLTRYCLAKLVCKKMSVEAGWNDKFEKFAFWLIFLSLPATASSPVYTVASDFQFTSISLKSLSILNMEGRDLSIFFKISSHGDPNQKNLFANYRIPPIYEDSLKKMSEVSIETAKFIENAKPKLYNTDYSFRIEGAMEFWFHLCRSSLYHDAAPYKKSVSILSP